MYRSSLWHNASPAVVPIARIIAAASYGIQQGIPTCTPGMYESPSCRNARPNRHSTANTAITGGAECRPRKHDLHLLRHDTTVSAVAIVAQSPLPPRNGMIYLVHSSLQRQEVKYFSVAQLRPPLRQFQYLRFADSHIPTRIFTKAIAVGVVACRQPFRAGIGARAARPCCRRRCLRGQREWIRLA